MSKSKSKAVTNIDDHMLESSFTLEGSTTLNDNDAKRRSTAYLRRRSGVEKVPGESGMDKIGSWAEGFNEEVDYESDLKKAKTNLWIYIVLYTNCCIASILFLLGSMCFLPEQTVLGGGLYTDQGSYMFCAGVTLFMITQMWSTYNIFLRHLPGTRNTLAFYADCFAEFLCHLAYVIGYMPGSVLFISKFDALALGAKCFVWGSLIIMLGFFIQNLVFNYLNKVGGEDYFNTQCDTTAYYFYMCGALLWCLASVLYFIPIDDTHMEIWFFAAMMYVVGSCFFLLGCMVAILAMYRRLKKINEKLSLLQ